MTEKKNPFCFEYTMPSLDWYVIHKVEIKPDDYCYFELQRRYGPTWWLIGSNPPPKNSGKYEWTRKVIGKIPKCDLARFIEWAKLDNGGSKITNISAISGSFDILKEIENILASIKRRNENG